MTGPIVACQLCGSSDLRSALFLGYLPPVNAMNAIGATPDAETWYPAELLVCPNCHLAQLGYSVDPAALFPPGYPYTSGSTRVLRENFAELYAELRTKMELASDDLVVDIGSNDGTLLANFRDGGHRVLGVEPTLTGKLAEQRGIETLSMFFGDDAAGRIVSEHGRARVVTAANVFAHIPDVHATLDAIEEILDDGGVFISESHYLRDLIESLQYDTIYHEHLRYYSLTSLSALFKEHGFDIVHAKRIPTHGGSIRVYAAKNGAAQEESVRTLLGREREAGLADESWVDSFRRRVSRSKLDLYDLLASIRSDGIRIYGVGAPSRASTLVTYVGLDDGLLDYVLELPTSLKVGKYLPGTKIPVVDEARLFEDQPEYALLLSWHIADELVANLRRKGFRGRFITPLPEPKVLTGK